MPRGPLCKTYRRELAKTSQGLGLVELNKVERRDVRYSTGTGGSTHPAFATAAIDISAVDLYDEVGDITWEVAGDISVWCGGVPQLLTKLADRMGRLADEPNCGRDYK